MSDSDKQHDVSMKKIQDAQELRSAVDELSQSIAYLSKMVLQLQKSVNASTQTPSIPKASQTVH